MQAPRPSVAGLALTIVVLSTAAFPGDASGAPASKDVTVTNDAAEPVPVRDVDGPSREPFQTGAEIENTVSGGAIIATVPFGKRLVIEFLSASCNSQDAVRPTKLLVKVVAAFSHFFSLDSIEFGTGYNSTATHPTRMYVESGSDIKLDVFPTTATPTITCSVWISGHLVDP